MSALFRPLTAASVNGDIEAVQTLIQAGAEVVGLTVLEKAKTREIYKLLKRACEFLVKTLKL